MLYGMNAVIKLPNTKNPIDCVSTDYDYIYGVEEGTIIPMKIDVVGLFAMHADHSEREKCGLGLVDSLNGGHWSFDVQTLKEVWIPTPDCGKIDKLVRNENGLPKLPDSHLIFLKALLDSKVDKKEFSQLLNRYGYSTTAVVERNYGNSLHIIVDGNPSRSVAELFSAIVEKE